MSFFCYHRVITNAYRLVGTIFSLYRTVKWGNIVIFFIFNEFFLQKT
jgi:hypothetical protein